jgi:hypothetical protein
MNVFINLIINFSTVHSVWTRYNFGQYISESSTSDITRNGRRIDSKIMRGSYECAYLGSNRNPRYECNIGELCACIHEHNGYFFYCVMLSLFPMFWYKVCREVDKFFKNVALQMPCCKNVELGGRDGMKKFSHGISIYMRPKIRRINGGWWIAIARQLRVLLCFTELVRAETRRLLSHALRLLLRVHHAVRNPLLKTELHTYADNITELIQFMVLICEPHTPSGCHSIKYHWPLHWWITRRELGCSANEKSLERKLGEVQKTRYQHTNSRYNIEVIAIKCRNLLNCSLN